MSKLTNITRNFIHSKIMAYAFENRVDALKKREYALARRVLLDEFGRDAFEKFAAVPEGWLPSGNRVWIVYGKLNRAIYLAEARALPMFVINGRGPIKLNERTGRQLETLVEDQRLTNEDRRALDQEVMAQLQLYTTEAQLRDAWPEAHSYLTTRDAPNYPLPAPRLQDLKKRIDLMREGA